ncbi:MAG: hypothetical protein ACREDR_34025, partial [Blastocatellia bacterium]
LIQALGRQGWTLAAIAGELGVRPDTVATWLAQKALAHSFLRHRLRALSRTERQSRVLQRPRPGPLTNNEASVASKLTVGLRLSEPSQRVDAIKELLAKSGMSRRELSNHLGVSLSTVRNYLDPRVSHRIALPVLMRFITLFELDRLALLPQLSRAERFDRTARTLFGSYYHEGFDEKDRAFVVDLIRRSTRCSARTVRRYLPPYHRPLQPGLIFLDRLEALLAMLLPGENILDAACRFGQLTEDSRVAGA